ncbi:non-ribosomal peptide synthetase [Lentzea kentuckyensis]|uniref:non-ribosomal peptide synthetase n=1 Tax=Lentzea kentuckyensis TaxID=360086 RepID=UPI000A3BE526|nr:non-ribosomal peptide synthetase [Lentzea kentuckyensis]
MSTLHGLVADQARRSPDAVAVVAGDERVSFAELDQRANRLAGHLASVGAGPETVVAVCLPRSVDLIAAMLGVLKTGAAYLPIDPAEAPERRRFIVRDADVLLTITAERLAQDRAAIDARPGTFTGPPTDPANLAYVIYTSGSTGAPKGVMVQHDSVVNYLRWALSAYNSAGDRGVPLHSAVNTDLSVTSLFVPLLAGQPVVVLPEEDPPVNFLPRAMASGGFRFVKLTPAHLELLADALAPADAANASTRLVVGGDALTYRALEFWRDSGVTVVNEYGPTETTVACCAFETSATGEGPVPIGTAIAGARLHVFDDSLHPVPDGEVGELYVGGTPVSRGYLGRPGLTAASFLPDPSGGRMYRTGDLVHQDPSGRLVYHGRVDHQIKLRGYRIEPGEIEEVLAAHPGVQSVAVGVQNQGTSRAALVAHVVACSSTADLLDFAAERLPGHMIPAEVRLTDSLPLTRQGKIDRSRLGSQPAAAPVDSAPRTPLEESIAENFADLLDLSSVDVRLSFFEQGGNSLLAARLVARLIRAYQVDLPVATWLEDASVAGFAQLISTYREHGKQAALSLHAAPEFDDLSLDDEILGDLHAAR